MRAARLTQSFEHPQIGYRINEYRPEGTVYSFNGFAVNTTGYVQISMYFDNEKDVSVARERFKSLNEVKP